MRARIVSTLSGVLLVGTSLALITSPATAESADSPDRSVTVSGTGVSSYPAFDPTVQRYAVSGAEGAEVRVQASTSDTDGQVLVDGMPQGPSADVVVTGEPGEEVSVIFDDAAGRTAHSYFLLPDGFPTLEAETAPGAQLDPGLVLLTLSTFTEPPFFETAVDRNGVPVRVHEETTSSIDLKRQPDGQLTTQRASAGVGPNAGAPLVVLGEDWQPTGETHATVGLDNTDPHDSILMPDGSVILLSYEFRDTPSGQVQDSVVQEIDPDGNQVFEWSTESLVLAAETVKPGDPDYAHINSVVVMDDGHWLLSFRHFSAVFKIARFDDGTHEAGDVIWRLGGRNSDFAFPDDPWAGPCAQHTASELPNGNILIYDNGGAHLGDNSPTLCVDPADPAGGLVNRAFTRITEYRLDEQTMEATLASEFAPEGRFAYFAGGVAQLPSGHRLIGWAASRVEIATELDTDGESTLWTLRDTHPDQESRLFTYRAHLAEVADVINPTVTIADPGEVAQGATVRLDWQCRDTGGSGLADCAVTNDGVLDTSTPGERHVTVTATDGAGNVTTRDATYVVFPADRAVDAAVRIKGGKWKGVDTVGAAKKQQVTTKLKKMRRKRVAHVRITNNGDAPDSFRVRGKAGNKVVKAIYRLAGRKVTGKVTGAGVITPTLAPGESTKLKITFKRKRAVKRNRRFPVRVKSTSDGTVRDAVRVKVKVRK